MHIVAFIITMVLIALFDLHQILKSLKDINAKHLSTIVSNDFLSLLIAIYCILVTVYCTIYTLLWLITAAVTL